jgi:hypothetical protein
MFPRELSTFRARDRGQEYLQHGATFLRQNAVAVTAQAPLALLTRTKPLFSLWQAQSNDQDHQIFTLTAAAEIRPMKVMTSEPGVHSATAAGAHEVAALRAYYLPWQSNNSYSMTLGAQADFFFTAPMNGCAFFVTGDRQTPTVYHSNYYLDPDQHALTNEVRYQRRRAFYAGFQRMIVGTAGTTALLPDFYLSLNGVISTVTSAFGFRDRNSGEWSFYYHVVLGSNQPYANTNAQVTVQYSNKPYFMTGPLWPVMQQPAWRSWLGHYLLG